MKCPICNNNCDTFSDPVYTIDYYECCFCRYIFKAPKHRKSLVDQKLRYDLHQNYPCDDGYRAYFQRFLDFVLPRVSSDGRALDFGSGISDLLSSILADSGYVTDRYDPIYHPADIYRGHKYDLIVSVEVFEHLYDPYDTIKDLKRLLKSDGGYLALQTQFAPLNREEFLDWYYRLDPTHIGFFTPFTFQKISQICNLKYVIDDGINKVIFQK